MFTRLALVTIAALVLLGTGSALAATTVTVTRTDDPPPGSGNLCGPPSLNCSLRHAIAAVQGGSNTEVDPSVTRRKRHLAAAAVRTVVRELRIAREERELPRAGRAVA